MKHDAPVLRAALAALPLCLSPLHATEIFLQPGAEITIDGIGTGVIYSDAQDAEIREVSPATNFDGGTGGPGGVGGGDSELLVDADTPGTSGLRSQALLRFDGLTGNAPGMIPPGSSVTRAILRIDVDDSGNPISLHSLHFPWDESLVTWDNAGTPGNGIDGTTDSTFLYSYQDQFGASPLNEVEEFDVTVAMEAAIADPPSHHGFGLLPQGADGVAFNSIHYTDFSPDGGVSRRPSLTITFSAPLADVNASETPSGDVQVDIIAPTPHPTIFDLQVSNDLFLWNRVAVVSAPLGLGQFIDSVGPEVRRFYRAAELPALPGLGALGEQPLLIQEGYAPGTVFEFDLDGDTLPDQAATVGVDGVLVVALDLTGMGVGTHPITYTTSNNGVTSAPAVFDAEITSPSNPGNAPVFSGVPDAAICECEELCPPSAGVFTGSFTPSEHGVELASGKARNTFPITSFKARGIDFDLRLFHSSMLQYDGPFGNNYSHSYNVMITRFGPNDGQIVTPNLRTYQINSPNGIDWNLPEGFFSRLRLDPNTHRWTLDHYTGLELQFYEGQPGQPGRLLSLSDPNGNAMRFGYDPSGLLTSVTTPLGQIQTFEYDLNGRLAHFRNHLGHATLFQHSPGGHLQQIEYPPVSWINVNPGQLIDDANLGAQTIFSRRNLFLQYQDPNHPNHLTEIFDGRGALVKRYAYDPVGGQARGQEINGTPEFYDYGAVAGGPPPLPLLDPGNFVTRVIDRGQNLVDYEIHGPAGGPLGAGAAGMRRVVTWTATGQGNPPLRPGEPDYYEQRYLYDCDCLKPAMTGRPQANTDPVVYDANQMPLNWPRREYTYNANRQALLVRHTDGADTITEEYTYQAQSFGDGNQYSRRLSYIAPRQFDTHPVNAGMTTTHIYTYDPTGNRLTHESPTVTRGIGAPQTVTRTWTYNSSGQVTSYTDPNGNRIAHQYNTGTSTGGDINTQGTFGGYRRSSIYGATGSSGGAIDITHTFSTNSLGMITNYRDPNGNPYQYFYNDAGECRLVRQPVVNLTTGGAAQYETRCFYDGASNRVMIRRTNIDETGALSAGNPLIDRAFAYDAIGNQVAHNVETDETTHLVTRYAYDSNDQRIVIQEPRGNRVFLTYDERRLKLRTFYGISPGATTTDGYPASDADTTLVGPSFVGVERRDYDGRGNCTGFTDGRGFLWNWHYDFYDRKIAHRDPNGNGWTCAYDDGSHKLTRSRGQVDPGGNLLTARERLYCRYDELGRIYQKVWDLNLPSSEDNDLDPDDGANSSSRYAYDAANRPVGEIDAEGNLRVSRYDGANRIVASDDALGNTTTYTYDANGNLVAKASQHFPGPGLVGVGDPASETYVRRFDFDELDRLVVEHDHGRDGISIDHQTSYAYDARNNTVRRQDAEGRVTRITYDDADRVLRTERFEDPTLTTRLRLDEYVYDDNSNQVVIRNFTDESNPGTAEETRCLYDDLNRLVRKIDADSDDPDTGPGLGGDGVFDRREYIYDENSNRVVVKDQREVVSTYTYDPANRKVSRVDALSAGVAGNTRTRWTYDELDRVVTARNDYSEIAYAYDPLSRSVSETQSIRLDGTGFTNGYQFPVIVGSAYDRESNRTTCDVREGLVTDLVIVHTYDALNRLDTAEADYFGSGLHPVADRDYYGPSRIGSCTYGNGARITSAWDSKRRITRLAADGPVNRLTSYEYEYDRVDKPAYERLGHDNGRYDHFDYNQRDELTGAEYRSNSAVPPGSPFTTNIQYDSHYNRVAARYGDAVNNGPIVNDNYGVNRANEYDFLARSTSLLLGPPAHDRAGNATTFPVLTAHQPTDLPAGMSYEAANTLFTVSIPGVADQQYRYDARHRRIATLEGATGSETPVRRFIYDGWRVIEERTFDPGATPANAPSTLERVYVHGGDRRAVDDLLLQALDADGDRRLGLAGGGTNPLKNVPDPSADKEYYYLYNRLGSVAGLSNADDPDHVLEYYRYTATGEPSVLPGLGPLDTADQNLDNNLLAGLTRHSLYDNSQLFTGRRWDDQTGLYYHRNRFYEPRSGRFLQRDPIEEEGGLNLYNYVRNRYQQFVDPYGLDKQKPVVAVDGWKLTIDAELPRRVRQFATDAEYHAAWDKWWNTWFRDFKDEPDYYIYVFTETTEDDIQRYGDLVERGVRKAIDQAGKGNGRWTTNVSDYDVDKLNAAAEKEGGTPTEQPEPDYTIKMEISIRNIRDLGWVKTGLCSWEKGPPVADYTITLWTEDAEGNVRKKRKTFKFTHSAGDPAGAGERAGNMFLLSKSR